MALAVFFRLSSKHFSHLSLPSPSFSKASYSLIEFAWFVIRFPDPDGMAFSLAPI